MAWRDLIDHDSNGGKRNRGQTRQGSGAVDEAVPESGPGAGWLPAGYAPRVGVARTLVTSGVVWVAGSARAGAETAELATRRMPRLLGLGARATLGGGAGAARADAAFRDELLLLFDDVSGIAWRETRRARDELGARTSPRVSAVPGSAMPADNAPRRRYRVKS